MKRTIRLLAGSAATMLLFASCGTSDDTAPAENTAAHEASQADADQQDKSNSWPIVEDEEGNVVENPEHQSMDDGGDDTEAGQGNVTSVEFDGESQEIDVDALAAGTWDPETRYYAEGASGAKYLIDFGAGGPEEIEAYREKTGVEPVRYVRIDIDNTQGSTDASAGNLIIVDGEGEEYDFEDAYVLVGDWQPSMYDDGPKDENDGYYYALPDGSKISEGEYTPLQNEGVELYNGLLDTEASPRAKQTIWLIGHEMPDTMAYFGLDDGTEPLFGMPLQ